MENLNFFSQQVVIDKNGGVYVVRADLGEKLLVLVWYYPLESEKELLKYQQLTGIPLGNYHKHSGDKIYIKPSYILDLSADKYILLLRSLIPQQISTDKFGLTWVTLSKKDIVKKITPQKTNNSNLDKLTKILDVDSERLYLYGGKIVDTIRDLNYPEYSEKVPDLDILIYGDEQSLRAKNSIRKIITDPKYIYNKYGYPHHRMFLWDDIVVDPFFVPTDGFSVKPFSLVDSQKKKIHARVINDDKSMLFPSVYKLDNGLNFISFHVGHKMMFNLGDLLDFEGYLSKLKYDNNKTEEVIIFPDNSSWMDISADKRFERNRKLKFK